MSKLSFRARAVDVHKPMPVHIGDGVPPDYEFASVSRAVLEMPTGMEKDEETVSLTPLLAMDCSDGRHV